MITPGWAPNTSGGIYTPESTKKWERGIWKKAGGERETMFCVGRARERFFVLCVCLPREDGGSPVGVERRPHLEVLELELPSARGVRGEAHGGDEGTAGAHRQILPQRALECTMLCILDREGRQQPRVPQENLEEEEGGRGGGGALEGGNWGGG